MCGACHSLTDLDIRAAVFSIVGDMKSRAAMLNGVHQGGANDAALPFVAPVYPESSRYFWIDDINDTHVDPSA